MIVCTYKGEEIIFMNNSFKDIFSDVLNVSGIKNPCILSIFSLHNFFESIVSLYWFYLIKFLVLKENNFIFLFEIEMMKN